MHFIQFSSENVHIDFDAYLDCEYNEFFQSVIQTFMRMSYRVLLFASIHYDDHAILDLYMCCLQRVDDDRFHTLSIYLRASHRTRQTHTHTRSDDY